jgi:type I restriction enzyme S subunit
MSTWIEYSVGDIAAQAPHALATGPFGSSISSRFFQADGIPVIRKGNLSQDVGTRLIDDDWVFVSEDKAAEFSRSIVRCGDLVFTCWGTIDQVGLIDDSAKYAQYVISNKQMKLTPDPARFDSYFLYYLFKSSTFRDRIRSIAIGSSVPGFNLGQLRKKRIRAPEVAEQRTIAHVLRVLDDKIQLNRRISRELEELARILFTSWFVDFDPVAAKRDGRPPVGVPAAAVDLFPCHFEDSKLGPIPKGWQVGSLGDVARDIRRQASPLDVASDTPYIGLEHMPRKSIRLDQWGMASDATSGKFRFDAGNFLFGKLRPYFHKVGVAQVAGVCSTDIVVVEPRNPDYMSFVLGHLSSVEFVDYNDAASGGTRMPRTSWHIMSLYPVVLPPAGVARALNSLLVPIIAHLKANTDESRTLAELRDTLLGPLLSGELTIKAAEKAIEAAV